MHDEVSLSREVGEGVVEGLKPRILRMGPTGPRHSTVRPGQMLHRLDRGRIASSSRGGYSVAPK